MRTKLTAVAVLAAIAATLAAVASAGAAPPPPAKFWTVSHCEQVFRAHDYPLPTADGHYFHVEPSICVGTGRTTACKWAADHRSRLYSEFSVFSRSRYIGGVVRSFTIATRAGDGLVRIVHHGGDQYVGWPADFYMSPASVRLLATNATPARFRSIVAPIVARLTQQENKTGCTGA